MDFTVFSDDHYMNLAYKEALKARDQGEVPVGAVVVCGQTVVAKAHNQTEILKDVTAHAEILAVTAAANYLGAKYLSECTLYVTLEPCPMCAGALSWSQLNRLVFGASDPLKGFSNFQTDQKGLLHPKTEVVTGLLEGPCKELIEDFFREMRN